MWKSPQLAHAIAGDVAVPGQPLKSFRMDAKESGGLIAIQERLREFVFGHGSYAP